MDEGCGVGVVVFWRDFVALWRTTLRVSTPYGFNL